MVEKKKLNLRLEYPFKIDAVSVNEARLKAIKIEGNDRRHVPRSLENFVSQYMPLMENPKGSREKSDSNIDRSYQQRKIENMLDKTWPMVQMIDFDSKGRRKKGVLKKVPLEDIGCAAPEEALYQNIECLPLRPSSKKIYHVYARNLGVCIRNRKEVRGGSCKKCISIENLSNYFEYLEDRCLKSYSPKPYHNLLEIRLLFYVPLTSTQLNQITRLNIKVETEQEIIKRCFIEFGGQRYPIPSTYVDLAITLFSENEPLLKRSGKQLNAFVEKSSRAAKIREKITPTLIQNSLVSICRTEGYLPEWLPPR